MGSGFGQVGEAVGTHAGVEFHLEGEEFPAEAVVLLNAGGWDSAEV